MTLQLQAKESFIYKTDFCLLTVKQSGLHKAMRSAEAHKVCVTLSILIKCELNTLLPGSSPLGFLEWHSEEGAASQLERFGVSVRSRKVLQAHLGNS